ncbi:MAG: hypothetical protein DFNUSKGM_001247 [Candidatus Fervidibacter sacchari]
MGKRLLFFAIIFVSLFAFTLWRAQPPFRLQRKLLAKLPYVPDNLLVTDLDDDEHPEVMAIRSDKPPIWVRFPFDKPSRLYFENCRAIWVYCSSVLKALPVMTADNRLRLLRWKEGKAILDPLPNFPDTPVEDASICEGEGTKTVFLKVSQGSDCWAFTLTPQGEWQFASRFTSQAIIDLADLDRDGLLDALWVQDKFAWILWGEQEGRGTNLGIWRRYGSPQVADLDGDGWMEIVMVAKDRRLKIWQFDRRERRLKVIAASSPLPVTRADFYLHLFDLDGDGRKEILVAKVSRDCWVFQWRDGRLKMWQGRISVQGVGFGEQVRLDHWLALWGVQSRPVWLFLPRIWIEGGKVRWQFWVWEEVELSVFFLLPRGKQALSPSNWRFQEAPFYLEFAVDIDGDGNDEVLGYDFRWRRWRLYRGEVTKAGELRWRDVLLGRKELRPEVFALLVDGKRRGLVIGWIDGRLELLTMEGRR